MLDQISVFRPTGGPMAKQGQEFDVQNDFYFGIFQQQEYTEEEQEDLDSFYSKFHDARIQLFMRRKSIINKEFAIAETLNHIFFNPNITVCFYGLLQSTYPRAHYLHCLRQTYFQNLNKVHWTNEMVDSKIAQIIAIYPAI